MRAHISNLDVWGLMIYITHVCTLQCRQWQRRRAWGSCHEFFKWQFPLKMLHPRVTWLMYIMQTWCSRHLVFIYEHKRFMSVHMSHSYVWHDLYTSCHTCVHLTVQTMTTASGVRLETRVLHMTVSIENATPPCDMTYVHHARHDARDTDSSYTIMNVSQVHTCLIRTSELTQIYHVTYVCTYQCRQWRRCRARDLWHVCVVYEHEYFVSAHVSHSYEWHDWLM